MNRVLVSLHDQTVELVCPPGLAAYVEFVYRDSLADGGAPGSRVVVEEAADNYFSVTADGAAPVPATLTTTALDRSSLRWLEIGS